MTYTIRQGDALELMKELPDESIDLVVTDPPWSYQDPHVFIRDSVSYAQLDDSQLIDTYNHLYRVLKDGAHLYLFTSSIRLDRDFPLLAQAGFRYHLILALRYNGIKMGYGWRHEFLPVILASKNGTSVTNYRRYSTLLGPYVFNSLGKPTEACSLFIEQSSKIGGVVFDPFMGTGTTGVSALSTQRNFVGFEVDESRFEYAKKRIESERLQTKLPTMAQILEVQS